MTATTDFEVVNGTSAGKDVNKNSVNILKTHTIVIDGDEGGTTADTVVVTLADIGMSATGLQGVRGWVHSTLNSVVAAEEPTTAVADGVLTITQNVAGTAAKQKVYQIWGTV